MDAELRKKRDDFKKLFQQRCYQFSISILRLAEKQNVNRGSAILMNQLIRAGTSIGANVVEGSSGASRKEFINFFQIALKSSSETLYWLALLRETNANYEKQITLLVTECQEIKRLLSTIILNTKSNSRF